MVAVSDTALLISKDDVLNRHARWSILVCIAFVCWNLQATVIDEQAIRSLNILLTILGWLPGAFHAVWLIIRRVRNSGWVR
jgi:uncharacterized membrane protein YqaE (UPF0057 family)